jgi:hypothetical protein
MNQATHTYPVHSSSYTTAVGCSSKPTAHIVGHGAQHANNRLALGSDTAATEHLTCRTVIVQTESEHLSNHVSCPVGGLQSEPSTGEPNVSALCPPAARGACCPRPRRAR